MLPKEDETKKAIRQQFSRWIDASDELIAVGVDAIKAFESVSHQPSAAVVLCPLLVQRSLYRLRSIGILCEHGCINEAEVVTRALFETFLAAQFVMVPRIPQQGWSGELKATFKKLNDLTGEQSMSKFTSMEFRANLYLAADAIKLAKREEGAPSPPISQAWDAAIASREIDQLVESAKRNVGDEWVKKLAKTKDFSGFGKVILLREYCDAESFSDSYSILSNTGHGGGVVQLLGGQAGALIPAVIRLAGGIVGRVLEDFNTAFSLNLDSKLFAANKTFESATII